jgi:hypothetical protein
MNAFELYLKIGIEHILSFDARDHIFFVLVMICIYDSKNWKNILFIISSFTLAHSVSLALSVLDIINLNSQLIEILIALTIFLTCLENLFFTQFNRFRILFSGVFGLIHGLGFSNNLKPLLLEQQSILLPLFSFNLGVEIGQIIIVIIILLIIFLFTRTLNFKQSVFVKYISIIIALQSFYWLIERILG